ncbi:MAG TPA: hydrogenase 4 subunit B, partial [Ramlibacter sp.]|nr:hydrogenase 4 subunit B [Ramlibacter sp.]
GSGIGAQATHWWLLTPVSAQRASYSPLLFAAGLALTVLLAFVIVRSLYHGRVRRSDPWDCGFPGQTPRMQDTAEGFGQPIRHVFGPFFRIERELPTPFDPAPRYALRLGDRWWDWLYLPIANAVQQVARQVGRLQQGRIALYLFYSFATLLALLVFTL